jgi:protein-tyrosine-phosphatase
VISRGNRTDKQERRGVRLLAIADPMNDTTTKLNVLFVCIGNSCRSPMAESIALRDAADLFECASAGLHALGVVQKQTLQTLETNGYPTDGLYSKPILNDAWADADLVINMSGHPRERAFASGDWHKVEDWDVEDPYGSDPQVYQRIFEDIRTRIKTLAARLRERERQSRE